MPQVDVIRSEIQRLLRAVPFHPFALSLEDGTRVLIEHPENIAFSPASEEGKGGSEDFYVLSNQLRLYSTFGAVTSVALLNHEDVSG
jgi:hypothetical protein